VSQHNILSPGLLVARNLCTHILEPNHLFCLSVKLGLSRQKKRVFWIKVLRTTTVFQIQLCHYKRPGNRRCCSRIGHIFCCCLLIKINFVTENINYAEINTETSGGAGWNITADLKLVQKGILPRGPVSRIPVRLYGRHRFCYQNTPSFIQVSFLKFPMFCSFFWIFLPASVRSTFLPPHYWHKIISSWTSYLLIACKCSYSISLLYSRFQSKDPATYIVLTSSFMTL